MEYFYTRYKNNSFWMVASSYGLSGGISGLWGAMLDVNLKAIGEKQVWLRLLSSIRYHIN